MKTKDKKELDKIKESTEKDHKIARGLQSQYSDDELLEMPRREIIAPLNDREVMFAEYYIQDYNVKLAAYKAGYSASNMSYKLKSKQEIVDYITWLKLRVLNKTLVDAEDIFNTYAKMAFYDINDFVEVSGRNVRLKPQNQIDGRLIEGLVVNNSGSFTVKMPDRMKALEKLEDYIDNPYSFKRKIELKRLELLEQEMEISKQKAGLSDDIEDDGFIEALENVATDIFKDEEQTDE